MDWFAPHEPISAWTHGLWMLLAIPAGAFLVWKNRGDGARVIGMTVFSVSLVICFGASSLYHAAPTGPMRNILHVLDYLGIYLLIAGTVTPVALIVLRGWWRRWLLVQIWLLAAAGCVLRLTVVEPYWASTTFYVVMGWVGILTYFELARRLSHAGVWPLWMGGLCYTIGAVLEALRWPNPWPGMFGHHEIFHLWVMAGAALHYDFMLAVLTPYHPTAREHCAIVKPAAWQIKRNPVE
jgi:hemolysin III